MKYKNLKYRNFIGSVEYSETDKILFGKVQGIRGLISYEGQNIDELEQDFRDGIDEYLEVYKEKYLYMNKLKEIDTSCFYLYEPINEKEKLEKKNIINNSNEFIEKINNNYEFTIEAFEIYDIGDDELCAMLIIKTKYKNFHINFYGKNTYSACFSFNGERFIDEEILFDEKDFNNLIEYFKYHF